MGPDFAKRRKKLKGLMMERGMHAILTSDLNDVFYYTGYMGLREDKVFMIFTSDSEPKLIVSSLENEARLAYRNAVFMKETKDFLTYLKPYKRLGYDERSLNLLLFQEMQKKLKARLEPAGKIMEIPRIVKDAYEIEQMKKAVETTRKVMGKIGEGTEGKTEKEIADLVEIEYRKSGLASAFEPIVCSGTQSAFVHHKPNQRIVKANDVVLLDSGCRFNGYCSDVTRMFFRRLGAKQKRIYEGVKQIHDEITSRICAGVEYKEIEELQKRLFSKKGYRVMHGFGHGVGLSVHESAGDVLKENAVLTVEPGVYIKNFGGFRVEDVVLVRKNSAEILSKSIPVL